jgi:hypothetical protein
MNKMDLVVRVINTMTYYDDIFPCFCYPWHMFSSKGGFDAKEKSLCNCAVKG